MEVLDIMDMFSVLKRAHGALPDNSEIEECQVTFAGFHGNNETQQLAYVRFKVMTIPQWVISGNQSMGGGGDDNSCRQDDGGRRPVADFSTNTVHSQ